MTVVKHNILNDIAVIEISNPPVNAISAAVRIELLETVNKLSVEKNIKAIVITAPERLIPGIKANIWNKPINKTDLIFKSVEIFRSILLWSAKKSMSPKNSVVDAITFVFLKRWINSVEYKIYPKNIKGKEPIIIKLNNLLLFLRSNSSFLK